MPEGYFSIERDKDIIAGGGFFCFACCVGKLAVEQSPDPRYCLFCYDFLSKEAEGLKAGGQRIGGWQPIKPRRDTISSTPKPLPVAGSGCDKAVGRGFIGTGGVTARIKALASQGKSCRSIEEELAAVGVTISYRTIHRRLQGRMAI